NIAFQSKDVKIHCMHESMQTLLKRFQARFIRESVRSRHVNPEDVPIEPSSYSPNGSINFGPNATHRINAPCEIRQFENASLKYYVAICLQIRKRFALKDPTITT